MSTNWTKKALKARLRADIAFDAATRPLTADFAGRRLEYHSVVAAVEAGRISPEAGVERFDEIVSALV